ncbi:MAG TPA: hypothetical protein VGZ47_13190 [Gemmataceae bacterium]|nr:hypothetical protein [Gemmataceae bacterium]
MRRSGYQAEVCERWIPRANIRKDLFGILDIVAIGRGENGVLWIQATTAPNLSARRRKAQAAPALRTWLAAGNRFELWAWSQRNDRWEVKREAIVLPNLVTVAVKLKPRRRRGKKMDYLTDSRANEFVFAPVWCRFDSARPCQRVRLCDESRALHAARRLS